jgi:TatD DNase family protein
MHFFDSHFHLDLWRDPAKFLEEIEANKIYTIAVTNTPSVFKQTMSLTQGCKYVRPALGLHPELVKERHNEISLFRKYAKETRYIGEVGLDYSRSTSDVRRLQREIFSAIIEECYLFEDKILTIHSRKAEEDVISMVGSRFPGISILHWYSGPKKLISKAISFGFYFSVNLAMTLSKNGKDIIADIPIDRLLTESDGPFVTNEGNVCSPLDIGTTIENLSRLKNIDPIELKSIVYSNLKRILSHNQDTKVH